MVTKNTNYITDVADAVYNLILDNQEELQVQGVWYGDQRMIPKTPAITVSAGRMTRELVGVPFRTEQTFPLYIVVYNSIVTGNPAETAERQATKIAQDVQDLLHRNSKLGGLVIQSFVTSIQPGYTVNAGKLMVGCRIVWEGISRVCQPLQMVP